MKDQLIKKDLVALAKQKGFPQWGKSLFDMYDILRTPYIYYIDGRTDSYFFNTEPQNRIGVRPTQTMMCRWLREKHRIIVECSTNKYGLNIVKLRKFNVNNILQSSGTKRFVDYEEGIDYGIEKALKYLKDE